MRPLHLSHTLWACKMRVCECKTLCEFIANKTHHSHSIPPLKDQQQHWYCATISVETHSTSTAIRNAVRQPNSRSWPISSLSILSLSRSCNQFRMNVGNRCCRFLCVFVYLGLFSRFNSTLVFLLLLLCRVCVCECARELCYDSNRHSVMCVHHVHCTPFVPSHDVLYASIYRICLDMHTYGTSMYVTETRANVLAEYIFFCKLFKYFRLS